MWTKGSLRHDKIVMGHIGFAYDLSQYPLGDWAGSTFVKMVELAEVNANRVALLPGGRISLGEGRTRPPRDSLLSDR
jgi:hypothetical protein